MDEDKDDFAAGFRGDSQSADSVSTEKGDAPLADKQPAQDAPAASDKPAEGAAELPKGNEADPLESARREIAEALHRERSSANRLSHFMRENTQLKDKLADVEKKVNELSAAKAAPAKAPADEGELDDVLAGAPDLKAAVEARIKRATASLRSELDEFKGRLTKVDEAASKAAAELQPLRERDEQAEAQRVYTELDRQFTGWRDEVTSPAFRTWLEAQPREVQHLYQTGRTVAQAATVLKLYRADSGASGKPAPAGQDTAAANAARLKDAAGIRSKATTPKPDDRDSFSAGFRMSTTT